MAQHFLLSPAAKTLSLVKVMRMSEGDARTAFRKIRWPETDGGPICPDCGCYEAYDLKTRQVYKCKGCGKQKIEGTSTYRLPQKAEPPDEKLGGDTSRGSLFDPDPEAQGVKATPGGGP